MRSKQESSFCEQKEAKKLHSMAPRLVVIASAPRCLILEITASPAPKGKSFFASFCSQKEGLPSFGAPA
jgi:hypothetical protein